MKLVVEDDEVLGDAFKTGRTAEYSPYSPLVLVEDSSLFCGLLADEELVMNSNLTRWMTGMVWSS